MAAAAASGAAAIRCQMEQRRRSPTCVARKASITRIQEANPSAEGAKVVLQPRLSNLRSYGDERGASALGSRDPDISPFLSSLADYVENSRKSRDFETLSGRLAMVAFAAAVSAELATGNSLFPKLEMGELVGAAAMCAAVVAVAAGFAWMTTARARIGQMFTIGCNNFVDGLIDDLVDGIFYEKDLDN